MHLERLKHAENEFLATFPGGFEHPDMLAIGKKHKVVKLSTFCQDAFAKHKFNNIDQILEDWVKLISRSSMISLFEKPKFKSFIATRNNSELTSLAQSLELILHGNASLGFDLQLDLLKIDKLAKWTLITAVPAYYRMQEEIFIKPTTAKGIISYFELANLTYKPTPSWEFYHAYRDAILSMKKYVDQNLCPNNPAFCGFLMMSLPKH